MVAKGYKQTELGVIPDDWEISELQHLIDNTPDYGIGAAAVKFNLNLPVYLRITDITDDGKFSKSNISSVDNKFSCNYILEKGDIVIARTGASVGKSYKYIEEDGKLVFAGFLIRIKPNKQKLNSNYLFAITQSRYYKNWIVTNSMRSGQPGINSVQLNKLLITHPPLPEQTVIAEALSDMDALIAQTEQLIEKKKAIKQGMMHELLRPKEGWVTKKLGEIAELKNGYAFKSAYYNQAGEFLIITIANVQDGHMEIADCNRISHIPDTVQSFQKLNIGDILISMTGNVGRICKVNTYKTLLNQRVGKITPTNIDGDFLFYLLRDKRFINKMILSAQGGAQGNIGKSDILDYEASLPPTPKEQARIAQILSDMDSEIEQLEKQLSKAQSIKQGMMQQLLTGKTRLI